MNVAALSATIVCAAAILIMPGCVVWEVRDELRGVNGQLNEVNVRLDRVDTALGTTNAGVANANERLVSVDAGLERVDETNAQLNTLQDQLRLLGAIEQSLHRLDQHLWAVRKTVSSIDSMIPGVDLGLSDDPTPEAMVALEQRGDAPAAPEPPPGSAPGEPGTPPAEQGQDASPPPPGAPTEPAPAASARRDPLIGPWVRRYPAQPGAVVFLDGGGFTADGAGFETLREARWRRDRGALVITPSSPPPSTPSQPPPAGGGPAAQPGPVEWSIVSLSARSLVVRSGSGELHVYGRP